MKLICLFILLMEMLSVGEVSNPPSAREMYIKSARRQPDFEKANFDLGNQHEVDKDIIVLMWDLIRDTKRRIRGLIRIKLQEQDKAPFEIGYIAATVQDKYRRMVELYNNSWTFRKQILMMDAIVMSGEIQTLYFETEHLINMMHEVERKYALVAAWDAKYGNLRVKSPGKRPRTPKPRKKRKKEVVDHSVFSVNSYLNFTLSKLDNPSLAQKKEIIQIWNYRYGTTPGHLVSPRPFSRWRPVHYGWEVNYDWYDYNQMFQSPRKLYFNIFRSVRNFFG